MYVDEDIVIFVKLTDDFLEFGNCGKIIVKPLLLIVTIKGKLLICYKRMEENMLDIALVFNEI